MGTRSYIVVLTAVLLLEGACRRELSFEGWLHYLSNPANGLVQERSAGGMHFRMKYLPPTYFAWRDTKAAIQPVNTDSLLALYTHSLTFLLTMEPAKGQQFDVTRTGVNNYKEFGDRIMAMSFGLAEDLRLEAGGATIPAALAQMEQTYGLEQGRNVLVVFPSALPGQDFDVLFTDRIFGTGIHRFHFDDRALQGIPALTLTNTNR
ncbi:MAG: hypothetical protein ABIQ93_14610 [Saprospiraceae bacterium]